MKTGGVVAVALVAATGAAVAASGRRSSGTSRSGTCDGVRLDPARLLVRWCVIIADPEIKRYLKVRKMLGRASQCIETKVKVVEDALDANNTIARANRADFDRHGVTVVNL